MEEILQKRNYNQNEIEHEVIQFVDYSNSVIIFNNRNHMKSYLNNYFLLLKIYYNINKLQINDDKMNLILLNNPRCDEAVQDTKIITNTDTINPKEIYNPRMDNQQKARLP